MDRPDVGKRRAARADEVAKKMEVNQSERENRYSKSRPRCESGHCGDGHGARQAVQELMVPLGVEKGLRPSKRAIGSVDQDAGAVEIRRGTGPRDDRPISMLESGLLGNRPTR